MTPRAERWMNGQEDPGMMSDEDLLSLPPIEKKRILKKTTPSSYYPHWVEVIREDLKRTTGKK